MTDLAGRWVDTWAYARGLAVREVHGWPRVQVGSPTRETEIVCIEPGLDEFVGMLPQIAGDPRAMLTVIAGDIAAYTSPQLPSGVRVDRDDESLMTHLLAAGAIPAIDTSFSTRWEEIGRQLKYVVEHEQRVLAEGYVGVLGTDAAFDAVETTPAYQRQGLGRHVMVALTNRAVDRGATTGMLAATASGRLLYESLGWRPAMAMWSLMGVVPDA